MATGHLSYYETEEIEAAVFDLLDLSMVDDAEYLAEAGLNMHPNDEDTEKYTAECKDRAGSLCRTASGTDPGRNPAAS